MKIQYCSDLHLEFDQNKRFLHDNHWEVSGEILVLAGDIAPMHDRYFTDEFFSFLSTQYKEVFWVPGNHEYYHLDLNDFTDSYHFKIRNNVHLVHNKRVVYDDVNFVFSTLWSMIATPNILTVEKNIADFSAIAIKGKRMRVNDYNMLHMHSINFIKEAIAGSTKPTVVVTHHLPSALCNSPEHAHTALNDAYCVDMTDFIRTCGVDFWVYGHSHFNQRPLIVGKTVLLTNQLGMVSAKEHLSFKPSAYFSV